MCIVSINLESKMSIYLAQKGISSFAGNQKSYYFRQILDYTNDFFKRANYKTL